MKFVSLTDKKLYKQLLEYFLEKSTNFIVVYPNDETEKDFQIGNPLIAWKKEFIAEPNITILAYDGFKNAIEIHGKISENIKNIIYASLESRGIWQYSLWQGNIKLFEVSDFDDGFIFME